ncbi:MAG: hypothetical protein K2I63_04465 [Helicobacter sp.]|nr:hypothetical protein [Helicobacter sp.]
MNLLDNALNSFIVTWRIAIIVVEVFVLRVSGSENGQINYPLFLSEGISLM